MTSDFCVRPRPAKGHIPFPDHRTQAQVKQDDERLAKETQIMDLWDAGESMERIIEKTGRERRYVRRIISRYTAHPDDNFQADVRAASVALLNAIMDAGLAPK